MGHGVGYLYAHDYPNHYVEQQYMPSELLGRKFYLPTDNGYEKKHTGIFPEDPRGKRLNPSG